MKNSKKAFLVLSVFAAFFISACAEDNNPFDFDYSSAPDPFPLTGAEKVEKPSGLVIYILEEGYGEEVDRRNAVYLFYTGRTLDGKIFDSSYKNGIETPVKFNELGNLIEGFREGLLGMKVSGKRVLIIPPELGYGDLETHELRNDTLRFDIVLDEIEY